MGVALLNYMDRQMLSTMKDAMMIDITELESAANSGRLMAVFLWIYGFMSPVAGMIADRAHAGCEGNPRVRQVHPRLRCL